jgi:hypothetical protein
MGTNVSSFQSVVGSQVVFSTDLLPFIWKQGVGAGKNRVATFDEICKAFWLPRAKSIVSVSNIQSIPHNTWTTVLWNEVEFDTASAWQTSSPGLFLNTGRYSWFRPTFFCNWSTALTINNSGNLATIRTSGTTRLFSGHQNMFESGRTFGGMWLTISSGDYVDTQVNQGTGSNKLLASSGDFGGRCRIEIDWL